MAQKLLTDETGQLILQAIKELDTVALNKIGDLTGLNTSNKASLVAAINELLTQRGALSSLTTSDKSSIIKAINSVQILADTGVAKADAVQELVSPIIQHKAGAHNAMSLYKSLGGTYTTDQQAEVSSGHFTGIYPGCYWEFKNVAYTYEDENGATQSATFTGNIYVGECNYARYVGYEQKLRINHILVFPGEPSQFFQAAMNDEHTQAGGYLGSKMHTVHMKRAAAIFKACFGADHVLTFQEKLSTSESSGGVNRSYAWVDCEAELLSERMLIGNPQESADHFGAISSRQVALFRYWPERIGTSNSYWLRDLGARGGFACVTTEGVLNNSSANDLRSVRPYALIS